MRSRDCVNYVINCSCCSLHRYPHIQIHGPWVLLHWHQACHICRFWVMLHWHQADHNVQIMSSVALASNIHWQSFGQQEELWPLFMCKFFWVFRKKITFICSGSLLTMKRSAPRTLRASFSLLGEVLKTVTVIPKAFPNLIAMWPKPPKPTTPKCLPATSIW